jgi:quercetin dioxygenase-like cupin family protein
MKNSHYLIISAMATLMLFFTAEAAVAQDVVKVAPEQFKVVLENEHVRVLEFRMKPGDKQEMHTHPATVHIELTPTKVRITNPDGKAVVLEGKQGEALWVGPVKHTVENIGNTEIHGYIIELKDIPYKEKENK